jgi:hypothetical protein
MIGVKFREEVFIQEEVKKRGRWQQAKLKEMTFVSSWPFLYYF